MSLLETYLSELGSIHALGVGVDELTYYPALSNLLNSVGRTLVPQVRRVMNLRNLGAGMPDGELFTLDQFPSSIDSASTEFVKGELRSLSGIDDTGFYLYNVSEVGKLPPMV